MGLRKSRALGCAPSKMDGSEHVFTVEASLDLPEEYSYKEYMSKVLDQGQEPICVACSLGTYINWKLNMQTGGKDDHIPGISRLRDFFYAAGGGPIGMTYKDALYYLRHYGMITGDGNVKIKEYALVGSILALKHALIMNGPCLGALPVYNTIGRPEFWRNSGTGEFYGGHAISIIGWTKTGFIIRNSWGRSFGKDGYVEIPYNEFASSFYEIWTII